MTTNETPYGPTTHEHLVCVYCDGELDLDARVCNYCREYKGVMTAEFWETYTNVGYYDCMCVSDPCDTI